VKVDVTSVIKFELIKTMIVVIETKIVETKIVVIETVVIGIVIEKIGVAVVVRVVKGAGIVTETEIEIGIDAVANEVIEIKKEIETGSVEAEVVAEIATEGEVVVVGVENVEGIEIEVGIVLGIEEGTEAAIAETEAKNEKDRIRSQRKNVKRKTIPRIGRLATRIVQKTVIRMIGYLNHR